MKDDERSSGALEEYRRKERTTVTAVRVDLDLEGDGEGFTYQKWGGPQRCKPGDWLLNNAGDTYTVDAGTFSTTYGEVSPGVYEKLTSVWAERAGSAGTIQTKEGSTAYEAGDMLVFNDSTRTDGYAMSFETFASLYEPR